jgi:hypothetical protein
LKGQEEQEIYRYNIHAGRASSSGSQSPIIQIQQIIGNQTVQQLVRSGKIQAKLSLSQPGDIYEQEAGRVAEEVMRLSPSEESPLPQRDSEYQQIGRKCKRCEEEEEFENIIIGRKESIVSGFDVDVSVVSNSVTEDINNVVSQEGSLLDSSTREFMETRFGYDFDNVRIHTGYRAAESASSVNAFAYTVGNDIVFGAGQYSPNTFEGRRLLAHELVHVAQQSLGLRSTVQRWPVPSDLACKDVANWMDQNSPYSPEWAQTNCAYSGPSNVGISCKETDTHEWECVIKNPTKINISISKNKTDMPNWSPTNRRNRKAELRAWNKMKRVLDTHEGIHRSICQEWRLQLQNRYRSLKITGKGATQDAARDDLKAQLGEKENDWNNEAQSAQTAIDPFRDAHLECP